MEIMETSKCKGTIEGEIEYLDGTKETIKFNNSVLTKGRMAQASSFGNAFGNTYDFFISRMIFGDGGTNGGVPKYVNADRNGLFGVSRVNKPISSIVDPVDPTQLIITSVITFNDGNGFTLNEMALQMNTGDFYSMATFPGISKTSQVQITWSWRLAFI